jgi:hypothetical protein
MLRILLSAGLLALPVIPVIAQTTNAAPPAATAPAAVPATAPAATAPAAPPAVPLATAILDFKTSDSALDRQAGDLATLLEADMSASSHAILVERQDVDKILKEQELGVSGLVSADTAAKIGSLTGAQVLVTGRLFAVGDDYMIVAKIISTETSRVYGVTTTLSDLSKLQQGAQDLSDKIDGALSTHRDVLVAVQETPEQRAQRLKAMVGSGPLPTVSVNITERDYSQPSIDPAAQTEIMRELQLLGFTVIAPGSNERKADIQITGEAFSEIGARHGNLVSSRGRVEINIIRRGNKDLLWADRETRVGVDVGDRSTGKQALEKAADILVERMLPKITK